MVAVPEPDPEVAAFENLLTENLTNPGFRMGDAMEKTGYCADYFRRRFRRVTGVTPTAYLTDLRVQYAKAAWPAEACPGSPPGIAHMAGFPDPYYFSRVFKRRPASARPDYAGSTGGK